MDEEFVVNSGNSCFYFNTNGHELTTNDHKLFFLYVLCEFAEIHLVHVALLDEGVMECMGGSEVVP